MTDRVGQTLMEGERMMEEWRKDIGKQRHSGKDQSCREGLDSERNRHRAIIHF